MFAIVFHPDGKHLLGGGGDGIRRWRLGDGQEVGRQMGMTNINTIAASSNHKWVVCGADEGASVWDAELHEKVIHVEGTKQVAAVDVSPDSTRFATGIGGEASVWSMTSGERLLGPLVIYHRDVTGIRFSPNGEQIATFSFGGLLRIFDSRNGDEVITITTVSPPKWITTPLAWSNDAHYIFTVPGDYMIKSFAVSTGAQIAESPILDDCESIALAPNGKFIATYAGCSILFLDSSTLSPIVPAIEDKKNIRSIAISPDSSHVATGQTGGRLTVRNLGGILPDSYSPVHVSVFPLTIFVAPLVCYTRHLLGKMYNQTRYIQPRPPMTTNHPDLTQ